ncbi:MAG: apolipoprotein N-acyltransferase [Rhodoferax sp.]|nr:apolipoprotein N-acyltransferase [Rhodoferax sp.]
MRARLPVAMPIAILLVAAIAHAASVAWPFHVVFKSGVALWPLQILSLAVLAWCLPSAKSWKQAAALGWLFATVWLSATFWWLFIALHTYGGLNAILAVIAVLALAAALGLYYAVACGIYWQLAHSRDKENSKPMLFAGLWIAAELARSTWLTGFGWGAVGYAHVDGPLAAYAPLVGVYGMGVLAAWLAMTLASGWRQPHTSKAVAIAVLVIPFLIPQQALDWTGANGKLPVTLLQGNIPQDEKFEAGLGIPQALQWYGAELQRTRPGLVVAPETAIPLLPQELPEGYWEQLQSHFFAGQHAALVGIPLGNYSLGYTNSVIGLAPGMTEPWRYDKHHLVPFGEFIPPLFKWFIRLMHIPLGDFNRGDVGQPSFAIQGQRLAANICYEDLFGEELGVRFLDAELAPTIFVNVSNIGWFGDSVAIDQHLSISRMRALEFQRPFVRATNTGATVIIDHAGQVTASLPRLTRGVLEGEVQGRTGVTPYAWWVARVGLWPWWLAIAALVAVAWRRKAQRLL